MIDWTEKTAGVAAATVSRKQDRKGGGTLGLKRWALLAAAAFLLLSALATPAAARKRVALVIGNGAYEHVPNLPNPPNDATDLAAAFERLGYEVTRIENASGKSELWERAPEVQFSEAASNSEIAVVFYAGHGMEVDRP